jgi:hypothetical protein
MVDRNFTKEEFPAGLKLHDLVRTDLPEAVLGEVEAIFRLISPSFDTNPVASAFHMVTEVFRGNHPEYRACNTYYHDLRHTTDAFLAMGRLIHGAVLNAQGFDEHKTITSLIASLFHDTGYIQERHDTEGTGAKYSREHVARSMAFMKRHGSEFGLTELEREEGSEIIAYTDMSRDLPATRSSQAPIELLGRLLNAADLMGQMADRAYLEKLRFLYQEYKEGNVGDYLNEMDLLRKTVGFYRYVENRLKPVSENANRFMASHFASRWGIHKNLYSYAIEEQREYLLRILATPGADPRDYLHRRGINESVRSVYGPE